MNTRHAIATAALICLVAAPINAQAVKAGAAAPQKRSRPGAVVAKKRAKAEPVVLQKRSLAIPVNIAAAPGQPASPSECVITAGPAIPITALAFTPDGKTLAAGGYQEVLLWDLQNAKLSKRLGARKLTGRVRTLAFTKDGRSLAVADNIPGSSGAVRMLDLETGRVTETLEETKDEILSVTFSPDGKFLAAGGADALVRIWGMDDKKLVTTLKQHSNWVSGVAFSPDGKLLATGSADKTVQVWEAGTWKALVQLPQTVTEAVYAVAFSPDGQFLVFAVGGPDERAVRIWRTENAEEAKETDTPAVKARKAALRRQTRPFDTGAGMPLGLAWPSLPGSPARPGGMYVPCTDKTVKVLGQNGNTIATLSGHSDWVYSVAASADGTKLASGSADGTVKLWSGFDNSLLATLVQLSPGSEEFAMVTPRGLFAASTAAALQWKTADSKPLPDPVIARLQNADLLREALAPKPPVAKKAPPPAPPAPPAAKGSR